MGLISLAEGSVKLATAAPAGGQPPTPANDTGKPKPGPVADALKLLVEYIPTEVLALYAVGIPTISLVAGEATVPKLTAVAAVAGGAALVTAHPTAWDWGFYITLIALCPIFFVLWFFANAPRKAGNKWPEFTRLEWFRVFAAPASFAVWAMAIPGNPFLHTPGLLLLASLVAILLSGALGHIDKLIRRSMTPAAQNEE